MYRLEEILIEKNEYHIQYIQKCKVFKIIFNQSTDCKYSFGLDELDAVVNTKMSVRKAKKIISVQEYDPKEVSNFGLPLFVCDLLGKDGNGLKNSPWLYLVNPKSQLYTELYYESELHHIPIERYKTNLSFSFDNYDVKFNVMAFRGYTVIFIIEKVRNVKI